MEETWHYQKDILSIPACLQGHLSTAERAAGLAREVTIAVTFNNWDPNTTRMKRSMNGDFEITLELPSGQEYCFRYHIDGRR